ncbi:hypothetical protein [Clostridium saudiense]|nr:hypothetical protein [Clostridium saudiense]
MGEGYKARAVALLALVENYGVKVDETNFKELKQQAFYVNKRF